MPTLKEVLADKGKYQDNLVWDLGGGTTVTLGQLRGLSAEDQNTISRREQELTARDSELKKAQLTTADLYTNLLTAQEAIKAGRMDDPSIKMIFGDAAVPGHNGSHNDDPFEALSRLEQDTLVGPLVQVIKKVNDNAKKAQDAVAANINVQKAMATNYMNGVLEDRYDRIVPVNMQEKITLASLIQDAVRNNEFSSDSVPDIRKAFKRATAGDTEAAREKQIRDDERKKVTDELNKTGRGPGSDGIFVGQPGNTFGLDVHNRSGNAQQPYKSLDEAFAAAEKDSSIWSQVDEAVKH